MASSDDYNATSELCVEIKGQPSTEGEQVLKIKEQDEWMTPIVHYLKERGLPKDKTEARKIQTRATRFIIINNVLYKRRYLVPYLRCVSLEEADYMLHEIHEGICETTLGQNPLQERHLEQDITGQPYRKMHTTSSEHATSVNASQMSRRDQERC